MAGTRDDPSARRPAQTVARRRLVRSLWSLPVVCALLVASLWTFGQLLSGQAAHDAFARGAYVESEEQFGSLLEPNLLEPYLPHFNRGTARAAQLDFTPAIDDFERALELAPPERRCMVRVNLALSWEKLGDDYLAAGLFQGAVLLYEAGKAVIDAAGDDCPPPTEEGERLESAEERIDEKLENAKAQRDAAADRPAPGSADDQLEQLEGRGEQSEADKAAGEAFERGESGDTGAGFTDKPW